MHVGAALRRPPGPPSPNARTERVPLSPVPFPSGMPARNIQSNETRSGGATVGRPSGAPGGGCEGGSIAVGATGVLSAWRRESGRMKILFRKACPKKWFPVPRFSCRLVSAKRRERGGRRNGAPTLAGVENGTVQPLAHEPLSQPAADSSPLKGSQEGGDPAAPCLFTKRPLSALASEGAL